MSVIVQGVVTELVAALARLGQLDPEQRKAFYDTMTEAMPADAGGYLQHTDALLGLERLTDMHEMEPLREQ